MTEMEERVALAIFKSTFHPDDAADEALIAQKRAEWPQDWRKAERAARAALEAAHSPTESMMDAACAHFGPTFGPCEAEAVWRDMSAAALSPSPSPPAA